MIFGGKILRLDVVLMVRNVEHKKLKNEFNPLTKKYEDNLQNVVEAKQTFKNLNNGNVKLQIS